MENETIETNNTEDVVETATEVTVGDVLEAQKIATLEQFKKLPEVRLAQAVPFTIPDSDITVLLAKCDATTKYMMTIQQLKASGTEDEDERIAFLKAMNNGFIKSCVVEPKLDDEAIEALQQFTSSGFEALLGKCAEITGNTQAVTEITEAFS